MKTILWLALVAMSFSTTTAQVAIYDLDFKKTGNSLNYDFYDGGYFICELPEGTGTFILTAVRSGKKLYTTSTDSGSLILVEKGKQKMAVIGATGGSGNATSSMLATGFHVESTNIGGGMKMPLAKKLTGTFMAFAADSDAVADDENAKTEGFAGNSDMKAELDSGDTRHVNGESMTVSEATTYMEELVARRGYTEETAEDDTGEETTGTTVTTQ